MRCQRGLALAALSLLLLIAACTNAPKRREETPTTVPVRVVYQQGVHPTAMIDALISAYKHQRPDVDVLKVAAVGSDGVMRLIKENQADVVFLSGSVLQERNLLSDLGPYMEKSRISTNTWGLPDAHFRWQGRLTAVPVAGHPFLLLGNPQIFKSAGVSLPAGEWTWDQFREMARKVASSGQTVGYAGHGVDLLTEIQLDQMTEGLLWEADQAALRNALSFFQTMVSTDKSVPKPKREDIDNRRWGASHEFWSQQAATALYAYGSWVNSQRNFPWVVLPMPTVPGKRSVMPVEPITAAIPASAEHAEAAWEFLEFALSAQGGIAVAQSGYLPMHVSAETQTAWTESLPPGGDVAFASTWRIPPAHRAFASGQSSTEAYLVFSDTVNKVLSGTLELEPALAAFELEMARITK